jgi:cytochrome c
MKHTAIALCLILLVSAAWTVAGEKKEGMKKEAEHHLQEAVERGKDLFMDASLGTTGMSCNSCHPDGGMKPGKMGDKEIPPFSKLACRYPRYLGMAEKVMTLDQVVNWCIMTPMEGKPLAWDDQRLADLTAYVASVHKMEKMPHEMHEHMEEETHEHMEKGKAGTEKKK